MARIVKKEEYEIRQNEILDAAQRLVYTKGYQQMSIQDILAESAYFQGCLLSLFRLQASLAGSPHRAHGQAGHPAPDPHRPGRAPASPRKTDTACLMPPHAGKPTARMSCSIW